MIIALGTTPTVQRSMTFARVAVDEVNRAKSVREYASGKNVNVARVLHAVGEPTIATGILGGDRGKFMRADLDAEGIAHDFIESPAPTRLCTTVIDEQAGSATELVEESAPPGAAAFDALLVKLRELCGRGAKGVVLSGTLAPGAGDDYYAKCLRIAREAGAFTILDSRAAPLKLALAEHPTVVKPNRFELSQTVGHAIDTPRACSEAICSIVTLGAKWVIVTDGARPTSISDGQSFWRIIPPPIRAISAIGSGDAFAAGLAAAIARGQELPQACVLATACAAANAMTPDAGHLRLSDVNSLIEMIKIERDLT